MFGVLNIEFMLKFYIFWSYIDDNVLGLFGIKMGIEYFLYGDIIEGGKLFMKFFDLCEFWDKVILC